MSLLHKGLRWILALALPFALPLFRRWSPCGEQCRLYPSTVALWVWHSASRGGRAILPATLIKIEEIVMELGFAFLAIVLFIGLWLQT